MMQPGEKVAKLEGQVQRIWFGFIHVEVFFVFVFFLIQFIQCDVSEVGVFVRRATG